MYFLGYKVHLEYDLQVDRDIGENNFYKTPGRNNQKRTEWRVWYERERNESKLDTLQYRSYAHMREEDHANGQQKTEHGSATNKEGLQGEY